jgi:hypothetical protein
LHFVSRERLKRPDARVSERLLILVLVLAASVAGCAGGGKPSGLPVKDDFSNCSTGWSTDTDEFVSLSCTDDAYRVLIKNPLKPQNARIFFSKGVTALNVEADAARRAGPQKSSDDELLVFGVGCWASLVQGYVFLISPDGAWGIEKITAGASLPTPLAESETSNAIPGFADTNHIRGVCVGGGREPTRLALYVNGQKVAAAEDRAGFDSFPGFGFFVFSSKGQTDIRFDNLVVREPTAAEVERTQSASKLCKRDGIRYVGATAQGAEVCFTLTSDGKELVETGFSFVPASGCPDGGVGTVYSDYRVSVDPAGQFENPDGLTATIRGSRAAGVFEDSSICKGKTFKWTAQRAP